MSDFRANYVIALSLENLKALQALRAELKGLRDDASSPIKYRVQVDPASSTDIGNTLSDQVKKGIEEGTKRANGGTRPAGGAGGSAAVVGLDQATLSKLDAIINKLAKTVDGSKKPVEAKVDTKEIADAVAQAVARELAKVPAGSGGAARSGSGVRVEERAINDQQRVALKQEVDRLGAVPVKGKLRANQNNMQDVQDYLDQLSGALGTAFTKRVQEFKKDVKAAKELAQNGTGGATGESAFGADGVKEAVAGSMDDLDNLMESLVKRQQKLLDDGRTSLQSRFGEVERMLSTGVETVTTRVRRVGLKDLDRTLKLSTNKLEQAFMKVGIQLSEQFAAFTNSLVERLQNVHINMPTPGLGAPAPAPAGNWQDFIDPEESKEYDNAGRSAVGRKRRRIKPAASAEPTYQGARPLAEGPEAEKQARINVGLRQLEELRERERKRAAQRTNSFRETEARFTHLPDSEQRSTIEFSRAYRTYFNERERAVLRGTFGKDFGENVDARTDAFGNTSAAGIRVPFGQTRGSLRSISRVMPTLHAIQKAGVLTPELRAQYAALTRDEFAGPLLAGSPADSLTFGDAASLAGRLGEAHTVLRDRTKFANFARVDRDLPQFSPVQLAHTEQELRMRAAESAKQFSELQKALHELPSNTRKDVYDQRRNSVTAAEQRARSHQQDAEDFTGLYSRLLQGAQRSGYSFAPYARPGMDVSPEQKAILDAMADATGLKSGKAFGKPVGGFAEFSRRRQGVHYNVQGKLQKSPEEALSDMLSFGGEWHYGDFNGFTNPVFQPDIRDHGVTRMGPATAGELATMGRMSERRERSTDSVAQMRAELSTVERTIAARQSTLGEVNALVDQLRQQVYDVSTRALPDARNARGGGDIAAALADSSLPVENSKVKVSGVRSQLQRALARRSGLLGDLGLGEGAGLSGLPARAQQLRDYIAHAEREHAAVAAAAHAGPAAGVVVDPIASVARAAAEATAHAQILAGRTAVHAGGGGGGSVPPVPPTGGGNGGGPNGPDWRSFAAAIKELEHIRLTGLAEDMKSIADSMRGMNKSGFSTKEIAEIAKIRERRQAKLDVIAAEAPSRQQYLDSYAQQTEASLIRARAYAGVAGRARATSGLRSAVAGQVSQASDEYLDALSGGDLHAGYTLGGLAGLFGTQASGLASRQRRFGFLSQRLNAEERLGGGQASTVNGLRGLSIDMDAMRANLMDTVAAAAAQSPRFAKFAPGVAQYQSAVAGRRSLEQELEEHQRGNAQGPKLPEQLRLAIEAPLANAIKSRIRDEDTLTSKLLAEAAAEFKVIKQLESRELVIDRLAGKVKSLATYAGAGFLLYGAASAVRSGFGQSIGFEKSLADIQGVAGTHTISERNQIERGIIASALRYGAPLSSTTATAQTFAQTGIGTNATIAQTAGSLRGQLGAGLSGQTATEMLIAVDNITHGLVKAEDILDRISRVEAKTPVTAQDLAAAIQRVGPYATQLQPGRLGRLDALDFVIGATSTQVSQTRVSGEVASTALKFMLARLSSPEIAKQLQGVYGIKLAANKEGTELRPLIDIFSDIATLYRDMLKRGDTGLAGQLLTTVAGQRQVNQAAALFGNWDDVMSTATESARAWGDTQRRVETQMDTLAFQIERTKTAFFAFMNELLKQTGALGALKVFANVLGSGAAAGSGFAGFAPLIGAGVTLGVGAGARALAGAGALTAAGAAVKAGTGGTLAALGAETGGLLSIIASFALKATPILATVGTIGAIMTVANSIIDASRSEKELFGPPEIDMAKFRESSLYLNYKEQALRNGTSVEGLQSLVAGAAGAAQTSILANAKYSGLGPDIFTTDDDRRKYQRGLAKDTEKDFVDAISKAVPEIGKIADEAERTAAALTLLKQSAQVSQMASGYVAAYTGEQLDELRKNLQQRVSDALTGRNTSFLGAGRLGISTGGKSGFAIEAGSVSGGVRTAVQDVVNQTFGPLGKSVLGATLFSGNGAFSTIEDELVTSMKLASNKLKPLGTVFDEVLNSATQLNVEQLKLVTSVKAGLKGTPEVVRDQAINALGAQNTPLASAAQQKLLNQKNIEDAIYDRLVDTVPIPGQLPSGKRTGGLQGSNVIFELMQNAGNRRVRDLIKSGQTGQAAAFESLLSTLQSPDNRERFNAQILRLNNGASGAGTARERLLDVILRYASSESVTNGATPLLRGAGIGVDFLGQRASNAQGLLTGLFEARAQTEGDVLRAAHRLGHFDDVKALIDTSRSPFAAGQEDLEGERLSIARELLSSTLQTLDPKERQSLEDQLAVARSAAERFSNDQTLFSTLQDRDRGTIKNILAPGAKPEDIILSFGALVDLSKRILAVRQEELVSEQKSLYALQARGDAARQELDISNENARVGRSRAIRGAEFLGGAGAGHTLRLADLVATRDANNAAIDLARDTAIAQLEKRRGKVSDGDLEIQLQAERDKARLSRGKNAADIGRAARVENDDYGLLLAGRDRDFRIRLGETTGGQLGRLRAQLATSEPGSLLSQDAVREYELSLVQRQRALSESMAQGVTQGFRQVAQSYDTFKGPALGARILTPIGDTINSKVTDNLINNLIGPQGLLGEQFAKIFNGPLFAEADMIKNAHVTGIREGFAQVYGTSAGGVRQVSAGALPGVQAVGGGLPTTLGAFRAQAAALGITLATPGLPGVQGATPSSYSIGNATGADLGLVSAALGLLPGVQYAGEKIGGIKGPIAAKIAAARKAASDDLVTVGGDSYKVVISDKLQPKINIPSRSYRLNNPGNLEFKGQEGAHKVDGERFAAFDTPEAGYRALVKQMKLEQARGHTVQSFVYKYAPPFENDSEKYIRVLNKSLGVTRDTHIADVDPDKLAQAVMMHESETRLVKRVGAGVPPTLFKQNLRLFATRSPFANVGDADAEALKRLASPDAVQYAAPKFEMPGITGPQVAQLDPTEQLYDALVAASVAAEDRKREQEQLVLEVSRREKLKQAAIGGLYLAGNIAAGYVGSKTGVRDGQNHSSLGAGIGGAIGEVVGGPIGGLAGQLLGGFIGGRFGKGAKQAPEFQSLERIERNTRETVSAIDNQTKSLLELQNRLLNVPASFRIPSYAIAAGGGAPSGTAGVNGQVAAAAIHVHVNGAKDPEATAGAVVNRLRAELRGQGSFVSGRGRAT